MVSGLQPTIGQASIIPCGSKIGPDIRLRNMAFADAKCVKIVRTLVEFLDPREELFD